MYLLPYLYPYIRESTLVCPIVSAINGTVDIIYVHTSSCLDIAFFFHFFQKQTFGFYLSPPPSPSFRCGRGGSCYVKKTYTVELFKFCIFDFNLLMCPPYPSSMNMLEGRGFNGLCVLIFAILKKKICAVKKYS